MGPWRSVIGALVDCLRTRGGGVWVVAVAIVAHNWTEVEQRNTKKSKSQQWRMLIDVYQMNAKKDYYIVEAF